MVIYHYRVSHYRLWQALFLPSIYHHSYSILFLRTILDLPDILICGNCKEVFSNLVDIIAHKRSYCKLRFACKCGPKNQAWNASTPVTGRYSQIKFQSWNEF